MQSAQAVRGTQTLYYVEAGPADRPCVVFLHGYPDSHRVWLPLMESLQDAFHVVAFDLRGVRHSRPVPDAESYLIDRLLPDIACVLDKVVGPQGRVHLVGHDWGSTIGWSFITHPEYRTRVLSWQSVSGPHLGLWLRWMREGLASLQLRQVLPVLGQLLKSSYVLFLLARPLPEIAWWLGGVSAWQLVLRVGGVPKGDALLDETREHVLSMTLRPMALYRRNLFRPPVAPTIGDITTPVQLIIPTQDPFVSEAVYEGLDRYVPNLTVRRLPARHWGQRSHPVEMAECVRSFLLSQEQSGLPGA